MMSLKTYIVLYRTRFSSPVDPPLGFRCYAEDSDHAEEQMLDAEPDATSVWVVETSDYMIAIEDWFNTGDMQ